MTHFASGLVLMVCSLVVLTHCDVAGPRPISILTRITHPEHTGEPQPPGGEVPTAEGGGHLGDRCPFPPDENGRYPEYCVQFISADCECIYDDMHIGQEECVRSNRTEYEMLIGQQIELEKERDDERVRQGMQSDPKPFINILNCRDQIETILAGGGSQGGDSEGDDGSQEGDTSSEEDSSEV